MANQELSAFNRYVGLPVSVVAGTFVLSSCIDQENSPPENPGCILDADCDDLPDALDKTPNQPNFDPDGDGLLNAYDRVFPYDPLNGKPSTPPVNNIPQVPGVPAPGVPGGNTIPIPPGCFGQPGPDTDKDNYPDHCDVVINDKDSDGDGIVDNYDKYPDRKDRDGDGIYDGVDSDPDQNRYEQERRDRQKQEQEKRDRERQYGEY